MPVDTLLNVVFTGTDGSVTATGTIKSLWNEVSTSKSITYLKKIFSVVYFFFFAIRNHWGVLCGAARCLCCSEPRSLTLRISL